MGGDILILKPNTSVLDAAFLSLLIRANREEVFSLVTGTTVCHLTANNLKKLSLCIPEVDKQVEIAEKVLRVCESRNVLTNKLNLKMEKVKNLLDSLIKSLVLRES